MAGTYATTQYRYVSDTTAWRRLSYVHSRLGTTPNHPPLVAPLFPISSPDRISSNAPRRNNRSCHSFGLFFQRSATPSAAYHDSRAAGHQLPAAPEFFLHPFCRLHYAGLSKSFTSDRHHLGATIYVRRRTARRPPQPRRTVCLLRTPVSRQTPNHHPSTLSATGAWLSPKSRRHRRSTYSV